MVQIDGEWWNLPSSGLMRERPHEFVTVTDTFNNAK